MGGGGEGTAQEKAHIPGMLVAQMHSILLLREMALAAALRAPPPELTLALDAYAQGKRAPASMNTCVAAGCC